MAWSEPKETVVNGVKVLISEDMTHRNRHGAMKYMVEVMDGEDVIHTEFCDQARWLGHCWGQLLLPKIIDFAKTHRAFT